MSFSPVLASYRLASSVLGAGAGWLLSARARKAKEDPARLGERFARYKQARPHGAVIWFHAASVGESGVALALIEALSARAPDCSFLLSTGTRTSADLVARRAPPRTTHVYAPLDRPDVVARFIRHWRPDVGVFVESELWPNIILEAEAQGVKLALVNARMSPKTLARWARWRTAGRRLIGAFAYISAADARTKEALADLRPAPLGAPGNLKLAAPAPRIDAAARAALADDIGERKLWLAASTHDGEDEVVLAAHARLREQGAANALLIIAPRHPERGARIAELAAAMWKRPIPRRSRFEAIGDAPVYVADTLGELGLFYDLAPVALVAGSLLPHLRGHNPIEPAKLGAAILSGPYVQSFEDLFEALFVAEGAVKVTNESDLARAVQSLWCDETARQRLLSAAATVTAQGAEAFDATVERLLALAPLATSKAAHAPT